MSIHHWLKVAQKADFLMAKSLLLRGGNNRTSTFYYKGKLYKTRIDLILGDKCAIPFCPNHSSQGEFRGKFCIPCTNMIQKLGYDKAVLWRKRVSKESHFI